MSSLNNASTTAQVKASYDDNASYEEDLSVSKAKAFITACIILRRRLPFRESHAGADMTIQSLTEEIAQARQFVSDNDTSDPPNPNGAVKFPSFEGFRS